MKTLRQELLEEIDAFCERHDMPESVFGLHCLNDKGFVGRLRRKQRDVLSETIDQVKKWMKAYKPPKNPKRAACRAAA